jgi:hypothetical protein
MLVFSQGNLLKIIQPPGGATRSFFHRDAIVGPRISLEISAELLFPLFSMLRTRKVWGKRPNRGVNIPPKSQEFSRKQNKLNSYVRVIAVRHALCCKHMPLLRRWASLEVIVFAWWGETKVTFKSMRGTDCLGLPLLTSLPKENSQVTEGEGDSAHLGSFTFCYLFESGDKQSAQPNTRNSRQAEAPSLGRKT